MSLLLNRKSFKFDFSILYISIQISLEFGFLDWRMLTDRGQINCSRQHSRLLELGVTQQKLKPIGFN
jgi:hypothetical protein